MALEEHFDGFSPTKMGAPLKPMGSFPIVKASDILVSYDELSKEEKRLDEVIGLSIDKITYFNFASGDNSNVYVDENGISWNNDETEIEIDGGALYLINSQSSNRVPIVSGDGIEFEVDEQNQVVKIKSTGGVKTIDGADVKFFVGTQDEYTALSDEERDNLFAIITDNKIETDVMQSIEGLVNGEAIAARAKCDESGNNISETYEKKVDKIKNNGFANKRVPQNAEFKIENLPDGKTIDDIVGIGITMDVSITVGSIISHEANGLHFSSGRTRNPTSDGLLRFYLSSITHNSTTTGTEVVKPVCFSSITVALKNKEDGLYIVFEDGDYTLVSESTSLTTNLSENTFVLQSVFYWLA